MIIATRYAFIRLVNNLGLLSVTLLPEICDVLGFRDDARELAAESMSRPS